MAEVFESNKWNNWFHIIMVQIYLLQVEQRTNPLDILQLTANYFKINKALLDWKIVTFKIYKFLYTQRFQLWKCFFSYMLNSFNIFLRRFERL